MTDHATERPWKVGYRNEADNTLVITSALRDDAHISKERCIAYVAPQPHYRPGMQAANAALIVQAVNTFDETRAALEAAYANSCHRADTRQKWTARDQSVHEAIKAVLAKMEGRG